MTDSGLRRPFGVAVAVILTWLAALADLALGALLMLASFGNEPVALPVDLDTEQLRMYGGGLMVLGLLVGALGLGLGAGSQLSRWIVTLLMAARIAAAGYALQTYGEDIQTGALAQIGASTLVLVLIMTPRAWRFFAGRP